jgi:hypothetical protein
MDHHARRRGLTTAQYRNAVDAHLARLIGESEVRIRVSSSAALPGILRRERLGTLFNAPRHNTPWQAWRIRQTRRLLEHRLYGYPLNIQPVQRPVYGHLFRAGDAGMLGTVDTFGDADLVLKPEVIRRTTFAMGDTAVQNSVRHRGAATAPQPMRTPNWRAGLYRDAMGVFRGDPLDARSVSEPPPGVQFFEAQIHGGVRLTDISHVLFRKPPSPALRRMLEEAGVPWRLSAA